MPPYNISVSDSTTTSEFIDVLDNGTRAIVVQDSTITSEFVDELRAGTRNISVSDITVTSEFVDELVGGVRNISVIDITQTFEGLGISIIRSPATIVYTISLVLIIPVAISFSLIN